MARYSKKKVIKKKSVNKNKNKNTRVKRRVSRGKSRRRVKRKYGGGVDDNGNKVDGESTKNVKLNTYPRTVLLAMFIFALLRLERSKLETLFSKKSEKSEKINNFINALINLKTSLPRGGGHDRPEISGPKPEITLLEHLQNEYKLRPRFPTTDSQTASLLAQFNIPVSEESVTHIWEEITPDGDDNLLKYSTDELKKDELNHSKLNVKIAIDLAVSASKIQGVASLSPTEIKKLFGDIEVQETGL